MNLDWTRVRTEKRTWTLKSLVKFLQAHGWNKANTYNMDVIESALVRLEPPQIYIFLDTVHGTITSATHAAYLDTLLCYFNNEFKLANLRLLTSLEGMDYNNLSRPLQRRLEEASIEIVLVWPENRNLVTRELDVYQEMITSISK